MTAVYGPGRIRWVVVAEYPATTPGGADWGHVSGSGLLDLTHPEDAEAIGRRILAGLAPELAGREHTIRLRITPTERSAR